MKPLGGRAYGSIAHLPESKLGIGDKRVNEGMARICWEKPRDKHDIVIVQEKVDGSCCAIAKVGGKILALTRAGYLAETSEFEQHHLFSAWVRDREHFFAMDMHEGERIVGEWIAQAHGTEYKNVKWPFIVFDLYRGPERVELVEYQERVMKHPHSAYCFSMGPEAFPKEDMLAVMSCGSWVGDGNGPIEGVVYRVYRKGKFDFAAKYVRGDYEPGKYLKGITGHEDVWNWRP